MQVYLKDESIWAIDQVRLFVGWLLNVPATG